MMHKKLHIIAPYPRGEAPSQRFRFEQYLSYLENNGVEIKFYSFHTLKSWKRLYQPGKFGLKILDLIWNFARMWGILFKLIGARNIFIHREMTHLGPPVYEWILAKIFRKKYTYDFDDAIWIPNFSAANAKFQRLKAYWKIPYLIRWADTVQAGNAFLAEYAKQFNPQVTIIPTTIDTDNVHNKRVNPSARPLVIGWTGTHSTMHYLAPIFPVLEKLEQEFDFEFHVISNKKLDIPLKSLRYKDWNQATEIDDLACFHIGLMPLHEDQWSSGKCGFKALQYMALGAVAIVSPVGVNTSIVQHQQNGWIANSLEEWEIAIRTLLQNDYLREKLGNEARKSVETLWSVNAWKEKYMCIIKMKIDD